MGIPVWPVPQKFRPCFMETNHLEALVQLVLSSEILKYFSIAGAEPTSREIYICLDEL